MLQHGARTPVRLSDHTFGAVVAEKPVVWNVAGIRVDSAGRGSTGNLASPVRIQNVVEGTALTALRAFPSFTFSGMGSAMHRSIEPYPGN